MARWKRATTRAGTMTEVNTSHEGATLEGWMATSRAIVERQLGAILARSDCIHADLYQGLHHALLLGGKRLRPLLSMAACEIAGGSEPAGVTAGAAVELVHTYSLVHDDLPAMDDDALRRGQPTIHVKWDEATAVLVGDGLLTLAFQVLAEAPELMPAEPAIRLEMVKRLAQAAGVGGMVGGQALDMAAGNRIAAGPPLQLEDLAYIHRNKTGALIRAAVQLGVLASGRTHRALAKALDGYAIALGLAFQIADDVLDATGETARLGKPAGSDANGGKQTYVSMLGIDGARAQLAQECQRAEAALEGVKGTHRLAALVQWVRERDH